MKAIVGAFSGHCIVTLCEGPLTALILRVVTSSKRALRVCKVHLSDQSGKNAKITNCNKLSTNKNPSLNVFVPKKDSKEFILTACKISMFIIPVLLIYSVVGKKIDMTDWCFASVVTI